MFNPLSSTCWPLSSGPHPPALSLIPQTQLRTLMMSSTPPPDKLLILLGGARRGGKCRYWIYPAMPAGAWNLVSGYFLFSSMQEMCTSVFFVIITCWECSAGVGRQKIVGGQDFFLLPANNHPWNILIIFTLLLHFPLWPDDLVAKEEIFTCL